MLKPDQERLYRIIDANLNRTKEGLRVCEDVCRFILDEKNLTRKFKALRHEVTDIIQNLEIGRIIGARNIERDVGKETISSESQRRRFDDIFYANVQRAKESIRVLEELTKLLDKQLAYRLKECRYNIYALEKKAVTKL